MEPISALMTLMVTFIFYLLLHFDRSTAGRVIGKSRFKPDLRKRKANSPTAKTTLIAG